MTADTLRLSQTKHSGKSGFNRLRGRCPDAGTEPPAVVDRPGRRCARCACPTRREPLPCPQVGRKLHVADQTSLVCIGDSDDEMDAAHYLGAAIPNSLVKTVKLWSRPTAYELRKQLEVGAPPWAAPCLRPPRRVHTREALDRI